MSLLLSADYITRQLRISLLKSEDKPSERIIEIKPPKAPPSENYNALDYHQHTICEYLYQGKEVFTFGYSPPITLQNDYGVLKRAAGQPLSAGKSNTLALNNSVNWTGNNNIPNALNNSSAAVVPARRSSLNAIKQQEELAAQVAAKLEVQRGKDIRASRHSVIIEDFDVDNEDGYDDDDTKKKPDSRRASDPDIRLEDSKNTGQPAGNDRQRPRSEVINTKPNETEKKVVVLKPSRSTATNKENSPEQDLAASQQKSQQNELFSKKSHPPLSELKSTSALSLLIGARGSLDNPFASAYGRFSGKGETNPITLSIHIPVCTQKKPLSILVKRDATVEEVIGFSLYQYFEEKREPKLTGPRRNVGNWSMRIVEDDGSIDEDFPALERTRKIQKFAFEHFALCETSPASTPQQISPPNIPTPASKPTSSASYFLKVHLYSTIEVRHTTTLNVPMPMLLSEVLEMVCKKRSVERKDYILKMTDMKTEVDLSKTVESLKGATELILVKKSMGVSAGDVFIRPPGEETPPSTLPTTAPYLSSGEYSTAYKKYIVIRKMPMFIGRSERVLAIDGEYIHLIPPENRQFFDSVKTSSYHITNVISCKQNKKVLTNFRLVVSKDTRENKTYDFEAMSATEAGEICSKIALLLQLNKRQNY